MLHGAFMIKEHEMLHIQTCDKEKKQQQGTFWKYLLCMGSEAKEICKAFLHSICSYPTSIVWISIISPAMDIILSLILFFDQKIFTLLTFPAEEDMLLVNYSRKSLQVFSIIQSLCLLQVFYLVRRFYIKATRSAAPIAKIRFSKYTNIIKFPMFLIIITSSIKCFIKLPNYIWLYHIFNVIYGMSYILFFFCFNRMYVIKEGDVYPLAFFLDVIMIITFLVATLVEIASCYSRLDGISHCVYSYFQLLFKISLLLKQVCVSLDVLENRFLRLPEELL